MELGILLRLAPAVGVAVAVAWWAGRQARVPLGAAVDEVLRALLIGVVAARLAWLALGGPAVWRSIGVTVILLRAGVETWIGAAAAIAWIVRRTPPGPRRTWLLAGGPAAALAGTATWQALCGVEGVCAGIPVSWGVHLPGYVSAVVPAGYLEAAAAGGLAAVAWAWRDRPAVAVGAAAAFALTRGLLGFVRAPLVSLPSRDQVLSAVAAVALAVVAGRLRGRRLELTPLPAAPEPDRAGEGRSSP